MPTDYYTPLSGALWDYVESQDVPDTEEVWAELMDQIVERISE